MCYSKLVCLKYLWLVFMRVTIFGRHGTTYIWNLDLTVLKEMWWLLPPYQSCIIPDTHGRTVINELSWRNQILMETISKSIFFVPRYWLAKTGIKWCTRPSTRRGVARRAGWSTLSILWCWHFVVITLCSMFSWPSPATLSIRRPHSPRLKKPKKRYVLKWRHLPYLWSLVFSKDVEIQNLR